MLMIHRSNRAESLATALAQVLARPLGDGADPADVLFEEVVVVPSSGMERWLSMRIARESRICANVRFPFPASMVRDAMAAALGPREDPRQKDAWTGRRIAWRVLQALRERVGTDPRFAPLAAYLGEGRNRDAPVDTRAWGLARRIADVFDDYLTYRQDLVLGWEDGTAGTDEADDWQPELWRAIVAAAPFPHPAREANRFFQALQAPGEWGQPPVSGLDNRGPSPFSGELPPRLCLFGISTLPPLYLKALQALAIHREVHLFTMDPCRYWWGDLQTPSEKARRRRKHAGTSDADLHLDDGNPLLASLGLLGRDFLNVLHGDAGPDFDEVEDAPFFDPLVEGPAPQPTLLNVLQSDVLNLRHRRPDSPDPEARPCALAPSDRSITVHACHGPMRQVEVLHDLLLGMFNDDPTLQPRDVVVMTPDIEAYGPLVEAVFSDGRRAGASRAGGPADPGFPALPFHVADRGLRNENPVAEAVARLLAMPTTRLAASEVLDLLTLEPIRSRFGLEAEDLPRIRDWVEHSGIRWGIDEAHREEHDQPRSLQNTWRFGLDRLLVGLAMPGEERRYAGVLPYDEVEGGVAARLGRFAEFCETLFLVVRDLARPRPPMAWKVATESLVDALIRTSPADSWRTRQVLDVTAAIVADAEGSSEPDLTLDAFRSILEEGFGTPRTATGFLGGAVTFCAMVPLRAIPFRVVCLLGMDDDAFPRQRDRLGFDRISAGHQPGDRNPRDDDRYLFLEALLSARDRLAILYTGRSIRDNSPLPPAVPLAELLDVLDASFDAGMDRTARQVVVREHALQPFSPGNFAAGEPVGFDRRYLDGARRLVGPREDLPPLFTGLLDDPVPPGGADGTPDELVVSLEALIRFFQNPIAYLLRERLGLRLDQVADEVRDREPVELDSGEMWAIGNAVLSLRLAGADAGRAYEVALGRGDLPPGAPGRALFTGVVDAVEPVRARTVSLGGGGARRNAAVRLSNGRIRLEGTVEGLGDGGRVDSQYSKIAPKHELETWIRHLAASLADEAFAGPSHRIGRDTRKGSRVVSFAPLAEDPAARKACATAHLSNLLDLYHRGLRAPLLLLPLASRAYAQRIVDQGDSPDAREAARKEADRQYCVSPPHKTYGDENDPYIRRVLQDRRPLAPDLAVPGIPTSPQFGFHEVALAVWEPVLRSAAKEEAQ